MIYDVRFIIEETGLKPAWRVCHGILTNSVEIQIQRVKTAQYRSQGAAKLFTGRKSADFSTQPIGGNNFENEIRRDFSQGQSSLVKASQGFEIGHGERSGMYS